MTTYRSIGPSGPEDATRARDSKSAQRALASGLQVSRLDVTATGAGALTLRPGIRGVVAAWHSVPVAPTSAVLQWSGEPTGERIPVTAPGAGTWIVFVLWRRL